MDRDAINDAVREWAAARGLDAGKPWRDGDWTCFACEAKGHAACVSWRVDCEGDIVAEAHLVLGPDSVIVGEPCSAGAKSIEAALEGASSILDEHIEEIRGWLAEWDIRLASDASQAS
jgi:hypothetical protein